MDVPVGVAYKRYPVRSVFIVAYVLFLTLLPNCDQRKCKIHSGYSAPSSTSLFSLQNKIAISLL